MPTITPRSSMSCMSLSARASTSAISLSVTAVLRAIVGEEVVGRRLTEPGPYSMLEVLAPTMIDYASPQLAAEMVPRLLRGDEQWCQGFSEPGSGSDLASLTTRAVEKDGRWVINGQKVWTSFAQYSHRCILLTRTGDVKVMDFGIARAVNESGQTMTSASAVMGTAQYLSPEQARGEVVDARSDLYSTGVLLYELLVGQPPFTGESAVSIAYQHVSEMPTPPSQVDNGVSPEIDTVVLGALAKRADDRYQSATEFRADVERAIAGAPVTAAVPTIVADSTRQMTPVQAVGGQPPATDPIYDTSRRRRGRAGRSTIFWIISLSAVAVAVLGALGIGRFIFGGTTADLVTVPNLDGLNLEEATTSLAEFELRLGAQTPEISDRTPGTVIAQQPAPGESIEQGQAVNVTVSTGREPATVPQLLGLTSLDAVRTALSDASLQLGDVTEEDSNQPAGYVLAQDPAEGAQLAAGSAVSVVVSSGLVEVPDVSGVSVAQARSDIAQAGFEIQVIEQESDDLEPPGIVLAQAPPPGTSLERGSIVTITISIEPEPTESPTPEPTEPIVPTEVPVPTEAPQPTEPLRNHAIRSRYLFWSQLVTDDSDWMGC